MAPLYLATRETECKVPFLVCNTLTSKRFRPGCGRPECIDCRGDIHARLMRQCGRIPVDCDLRWITFTLPAPLCGSRFCNTRCRGCSSGLSFKLRMFRQWCERHGQDVYYTIVKEYGEKNGRLHAHGVIGFRAASMVSKTWVRKAVRRFGLRIRGREGHQRLRDFRSVCTYVSGYVAKGAKAWGHLWPRYSRRYIADPRITDRKKIPVPGLWKVIP